MDEIWTIRALVRSGDFAQAQSEIGSFLRTELSVEDQKSLKILNALCFVQMRRKDEALPLIDGLDEEDEALDAPALADLGGVYLLIGKLDDADAVLQRATSLDPEYGYAHARLAFVQIRQREFNKAVRTLQDAKRLLPDEPAIQVNLAAALLRSGRVSRALAALPDDLSGLLPDHRRMALDVRLDCLSRLNRKAQIKEMEQEIWAAASGDAVSFRLLGKMSAQRGKPADAEYYFRRALEIAPNDIDTLLEVAQYAGQVGYKQQAVQLYTKAIQLAPKDPSILLQLANVLTQGGSKVPPRARSVIMRALALTENDDGPLRLSAMATAATIAADDDDHDKAFELYDAVLEKDEVHVMALSGKGALLLRVGRIDEAVSCFEKLKDNAPALSFGQLVGARVFPDDPKVLRRIERMARRPNLTGQVRSGVLFNLAKAWEKKENFRSAFACVKQANDASRVHLRYSAKENRDETKALMDVFSALFFEKRRGWGHPSVKPVFIVGMPRSGTTLLEQIIGSHPGTFGAGELGLVPGHVRDLNMSERLQGSPLLYPESARFQEKTVWEQLGAYHLEQLTALNGEAIRIVDKLPHNFKKVGLIHLLFPNATIFHSKRDVRDIAVSNYFTDFAAKFGGMGFCYNLQDLARHIVDYQRIMEHWHTVLPGRVIDIPYEDVVDDTEGMAKKVLESLNLEWDDKVLEFHKLERSVKTASVWQVRQPIYKTSKEKWRRYEKELEPFLQTLDEGFVDITDDRDT